MGRRLRPVTLPKTKSFTCISSSGIPCNFSLRILKSFFYTTPPKSCFINMFLQILHHNAVVAKPFGDKIEKKTDQNFSWKLSIRWDTKSLFFNVSCTWFTKIVEKARTVDNIFLRYFLY